MQESLIIKEIQRLPLAKKFYVIEEIVKSIRKDEIQAQMLMAAEELYEDYSSDQELTVFTSLDLENFYEAR